jgi:dipeptide transport system ATP-binding protein
MELLKVTHLNKTYQIKSLFQSTKYVHALDDINFNIPYNSTLGLVGESGSGKSTIAKILTKIEKQNSGEIFFENTNFDLIEKSKLHSLVQMVFQDPYQSLNPRKNAFQIVADPLIINSTLEKNEIADKVISMLELVGLKSEYLYRYPHQFSGGQRQRLGIARALMLNPKLLILDEPVSALDVSIQAQVLNLLLDLQKKLKLSYLLISHDLSVIGHMSDEIMVLNKGKIVEIGQSHEVLNNPKDDYTKQLLESAPTLNLN